MKLTQEQGDLLSSRRGSQKHAWKQKVPQLPPRAGRGPSSSSTSWPAKNDGGKVLLACLGVGPRPPQRMTHTAPGAEAEV